MKDYHINIFYSAEDEGYIADIPDLEHCSAFGETPEQALAEALIAKRLWLEASITCSGVRSKSKRRTSESMGSEVLFYSTVNQHITPSSPPT